MLKPIVLCILLCSTMNSISGYTCDCYCSGSYIESLYSSTCSDSSCYSTCYYYSSCSSASTTGTCLDDLDSVGTKLATSVIVGIVVGSVIGLAACVSGIVLIICLCKKKPVHPAMIYPQQTYIGQPIYVGEMQPPPPPMLSTEEKV